MRFLKALCVVALVFAVSAAAYAETQSVKVSGDITLRGLARHAYDLDNGRAALVNDGTVSSSWATHLMSTAELQVDADLTDNVSGVVRLVNQRVCGNGDNVSENAYVTGSVGTPFRHEIETAAVNPGSGASFDVLVDLAYIELKEFLYSPLTLKLGRQDLWFGKGFIVGANQQNPQNALFAKEYTALNAFDAIRATLDYDPWTIDAVFAKINENSREADDDTNLWGVNVGYVFDSYNAEAEAYWWFRQARFTGETTAGGDTTNLIAVINGHDTNDIHTFGARGSFDPLEDWTMGLEAAYQCGEFLGIDSQINERDRVAYALDATVECRYWQDDFAWRPVVGAEYILYSGEKNVGDLTASTIGDYNGWDFMYRGKFDTAIREFQNVYYATAMTSCPSNTNQHQLLFSGTVEPTDSLSLDATYAYFWLDKDYSGNNGANELGSELDLVVTWDYTEDLSFNLLAGWFFPGNHFENSQNDVATDVVGTVKLSF
ncbi:MAG: alginate export family protein [Candidatus Omnitrophota bacterium]